MSFPHRVAGRLTVPDGKVTGYLLKPDHPRGGSKARFFLGLGFDAARVREFANALIAHARDERTHVTFGMDGDIEKMVCTGPLATPDGRITSVRSVWVTTGPDEAQLVTAVPARRRRAARD